MAQARTVFQMGTQTPISSRSVTRTLRLDEDVEAGMAEMAVRENLTFNLLANRALRKLVEWEAKADKFGFIDVPGATLEKLFGTLSDDEARELGRGAGKNMLPEMILFWFKKLDLNNALKTIKLVAGYGKPFRLEHAEDGRSNIIVIKHDRGPRVSAYYAELLKSLFESLDAAVKTEETDGQVVASITRPSESFTEHNGIPDPLTVRKNTRTARPQTTAMEMR